jgi:hypothetical protein
MGVVNSKWKEYRKHEITLFYAAVCQVHVYNLEKTIIYKVTP